MKISTSPIRCSFRLKDNDEFMNKWVNEARGGFFMCYPIDDMDREELMAVSAYLSHCVSLISNDYDEYKKSKMKG